MTRAAAQEPCSLELPVPLHPGQRGQPAGVRPARAQRRRHQPDRQPHHRRLAGRDRLGPALRQPGIDLPASAGGFSHLFPRPGYQDGVPGTGDTRGVPDVSADASGHTGMAIVLSNDGRTMIRNSGGTSASARSGPR